MGKPTGFKEFKRELPSRRPVELRILDWDEMRGADDPAGVALRFAHEVFRHACVVCDWDPAIAASADAKPPPVS